jgi:hypothetical protein
MNDLLAARLAPGVPIPLTWVTANPAQPYLNLGDALSAVMVAGMAMRPVVHKALSSSRPILRMAAVGTIGHSLSGGEIIVWGSGTSNWANPFDGPNRVLYTPPPNTKLVMTATRGPISRRILGEANAVGPLAYGDPVWLLPMMYAPPVEKRYELGVIIHLSDIAERTGVSPPKPDARRYDIPDALSGDIRLINTVTEVSSEALRERMDLILSCKRIVSTSLHGMVIAETYGIPCLYYSPRGQDAGVQVSSLDEKEIDLRIADFYQGVNLKSLPIWVQPRFVPPDWDAVIRAIDELWSPIPHYDPRPLIEAFPLPVAGLDRPKDLFERDCVRSIAFDPISRSFGATAARLAGKAWRRVAGR